RGGGESRARGGGVRAAAGAGDDQSQSARLCGTGVFIKAIGRTMGRDNSRLIADPQSVEGTGSVLHRVPVGLASYDDPDQPTGAVHSAPFGSSPKTLDYRSG